MVDQSATLAKMKRILLPLLLLAGCEEARPPAPTEEQNDQLNEVEAMLNAEGAASNQATREPAGDRP
jgi:hypothetical protein